MPGCVIPHTPIAVDYWKRRIHPQVTLYFLSHLHTDHTEGLTSSWSQTIYCSEITKALAIKKFNLKPSVLVSIPIGQSTILNLDESGVEKLTVTLINANHCPGAVMFVFEGYFGRVLHTGDFRYFEGMLDIPLFANKPVIDTLYLDNTYSHPKCEFPTREEATSMILNLIQNHADKDIVFAMDALGKEDLLYEVALFFDTKIVVSEFRFHTMELLGYDVNVFTTEADSSPLKVWSKKLVYRGLVDEWNKKRPTIVIFPTGYLWGKFVERMHEPSKNIYVVPYTDHSSFSEMKAFVAKVRPKQIVPILKPKKDGPHSPESDMSIFDEQMSKNREPYIFDIPRSVRACMFKSQPNAAMRSMMPSAAKSRRKSSSLFNNRTRKPRGVTFLSPGKAAKPGQEPFKGSPVALKKKTSNAGDENDMYNCSTGLSRNLVNASSYAPVAVTMSYGDKDFNVEGDLGNDVENITQGQGSLFYQKCKDLEEVQELAQILVDLRDQEEVYTSDIMSDSQPKNDEDASQKGTLEMSKLCEQRLVVQEQEKKSGIGTHECEYVFKNVEESHDTAKFHEKEHEGASSKVDESHCTTMPGGNCECTGMMKEQEEMSEDETEGGEMLNKVDQNHSAKVSDQRRFQVQQKQRSETRGFDDKCLSDEVNKSSSTTMSTKGRQIQEKVNCYPNNLLKGQEDISDDETQDCQGTLSKVDQSCGARVPEESRHTKEKELCKCDDLLKGQEMSDAETQDSEETLNNESQSLFQQQGNTPVPSLVSRTVHGSLHQGQNLIQGTDDQLPKHRLRNEPDKCYKKSMSDDVQKMCHRKILRKQVTFKEPSKNKWMIYPSKVLPDERNLGETPQNFGEIPHLRKMQKKKRRLVSPGCVYLEPRESKSESRKPHLKEAAEKYFYDGSLEFAWNVIQKLKQQQK